MSVPPHCTSADKHPRQCGSTYHVHHGFRGDTIWHAVTICVNLAGGLRSCSCGGKLVPTVLPGHCDTNIRLWAQLWVAVVKLLLCSRALLCRSVAWVLNGWFLFLVGLLTILSTGLT